MMISRELSVEDIGLFYSIISFIGIFSAYNDLGLTEALQYYLPHYFIDKEYGKAKTIIVFTWLMQLVSGFIISWLLYFWADWLATSYFKTHNASLLLKYFSLYFIIINLFQVISSLFSSIQNIKRQQWTEVIRIWSVVFLTFLLSYLGLLTTIEFAKIRLIGLLIALLFSWFGLKKHFWRLFRDYAMVRDHKLIWQQRSYGLWILVGTGAATLLGQINQQFALYFFWAQAAWYRTNYLSFYSIANIFIWPVIGYLFPLLNELYKKWEHKKIKLLYRLLFTGTLVFWIVGGIIGYIFAEPVAVLLFGENFRQSGILFQHYAPFIITMPLMGILFQDIASRGMVKQRVWAIICGLVINIITSTILWKIYGLTWLVYGQLIWNLVILGFSLYWYQKK